MKYIVLPVFFLLIGCTEQKKATPETAKAAPPAMAPVTPAVVPTSAPAPDKSKHFCSKGADKREVEIVKKDDGCVLHYTVAGKMKRKTTSLHASIRCENSEKRLIAKLEKTGFQCN